MTIAVKFANILRAKLNLSEMLKPAFKRTVAKTYRLITRVKRKWTCKTKLQLFLIQETFTKITTVVVFLQSSLKPEVIQPPEHRSPISFNIPKWKVFTERHWPTDVSVSTTAHSLGVWVWIWPDLSIQPGRPQAPLPGETPWSCFSSAFEPPRPNYTVRHNVVIITQLKMNISELAANYTGIKTPHVSDDCHFWGRVWVRESI